MAATVLPFVAPVAGKFECDPESLFEEFAKWFDGVIEVASVPEADQFWDEFEKISAGLNHTPPPRKLTVVPKLPPEFTPVP